MLCFATFSLKLWAGFSESQYLPLEWGRHKQPVSTQKLGFLCIQSKWELIIKLFKQGLTEPVSGLRHISALEAREELEECSRTRKGKWTWYTGLYTVAVSGPTPMPPSIFGSLSQYWNSQMLVTGCALDFWTSDIWERCWSCSPAKSGQDASRTGDPRGLNDRAVPTEYSASQMGQWNWDDFMKWVILYYTGVLGYHDLTIGLTNPIWSMKAEEHLLQSAPCRGGTNPTLQVHATVLGFDASYTSYLHTTKPNLLIHFLLGIVNAKQLLINNILRRGINDAETYG